MSEYDVQQWIERSNDLTFNLLEAQARSTLGLVPFVGAGISRAYGFKDWATILQSAAPPYAIEGVTAALKEYDYEAAAEYLLQKLGPDAFQNTVAALSGDHLLAGFDTLTGPATLLPLIADGPTITTNFDGVLERVFEESGAPFDNVISGPRPDLTVLALHQNRHVLIKIHGDWQDRVGRTFTKSDYDANYGTSQPTQKRELLDGVERLLFSSRSVLFLGASLNTDRTVTILKEVNRTYAGIRHFAIVSAPDATELESREQHLRECGVSPLWYRAMDGADHSHQVEQLLMKIIERMSVKSAISTRMPLGTLKKEPSLPSVTQRKSTSNKLRLPKPKTTDVHFDRVISEIERGSLTFLLGSAIHTPTRLMAAQFYKRLARQFDCAALDTDNFAIAQFIADRNGRETLDHQIVRFFEQSKLVARETHEFFANWPNYKADRDKQLPYPTILTTNYDDILERTLTASALPYHLFSYQATGTSKGLFYHRAPSGELAIIERPKNIRTLEPGFVVVKLNGGMDFRDEIPTTFATTRLDFLELAARIPDVLPAAIRKQLSQSRLLFLGHGLAALDVEALVRFTHLGRPAAGSWAITLKEDHHEYWRQCGVEILRHDINNYVHDLRVRLMRKN